jgi:phosphinothricin acetyltransferase
MIRMARAGDAASIAAIYEPYVSSSPITFEEEPPTAEEMARRVADTLTVAPWLVSEQHGEILAYAYAAPHRQRAAYRWSVDASVYVRGDQQRRGLGRALYTSLFALLRLQGFYRVHAGVTLPNEGSVALHESFGFLPVGVYRQVGFKQGAWHDVGWWQLALRDDAGAPTPPLTPAQAGSTTGWAAALASGNMAP